MTRDVLAKGDIAVATLRKPEVLSDLAAQYPKERLLVLKVDVTVHQDILDAFKQAKDIFGRVDVVVSNAGTALLSEIEGTPDDVARALFEVNFWGSTHVLQEAVRFMREENAPGTGGRIFQITSGTELVGYPACGFYSATKHGKQDSESLRKANLTNSHPWGSDRWTRRDTCEGSRPGMEHQGELCMRSRRS